MNFDIETIKRKMLVKYPFFGGVLANSTYQIDTSIKTAETDGEVIYYNPNFMQKLDASEQTFTLAHEVCHIAFDHINRSENKDEHVWNIATDAVINQFLKKDGLKLVSGAVNIPEAINYDAEKLYEILMQNSDDQNQDEDYNEENKQNNEQNSQNENNNSNGNNEVKEDNKQNGNSNEQENKDAGHDSHSMWKKALEKKKQANNEESNNNNNKKDELQKESKKISKIGEKEAFQHNQKEKQEELDKLKNDIAEQAMNFGTKSNGDSLDITDIGIGKPLLDWRYLLREAINYDVDWSYKNAYIEDGVVMANLEERMVPETEILLDTSGSIDSDLLKSFLRECKNILPYSRMKVGCFDTKFYGFYEIRSEEDIENMVFQGGGGTNFDVAVEAFTNRVENKIIFTDGYASIPQKPLDAIWIVFGEEIKPLGGRVITIDKYELKNLYTRVRSR